MLVYLLRDEKIRTLKIFNETYLAFQRKVRYRNRCPLFMYNRNQLVELFNKISVKDYSIEEISRDYFVSVYM